MSSAARSWLTGAGWATVSSGAVGVLGLVAVTAAARGLGTDDYGDFAFFWATFFGIGGVFAGLQSEVTRTMTVAEGTAARRAPALPAVVAVVSLPVALVGGLVVGRGAQGGSWKAEAGLPTFGGLLLLACLTVVLGVLAAESRWRSLAALMTLDALLRTGAVVLVTVLGATRGLPAAIAAGSVAWVLLLTSPPARQAIGSALAVRRVGLLGRTLLAMAAAGCTSLVVSGLPASVGLLRPESLDGRLSALLAALVLIRSGLLLAVYGARPVILRYFLSAPPMGAVLRRSLTWCLTVGGVYAVLVGLLGPRLLELLLGQGFEFSGAEVWWLAVGAAGLALMVVLGLALLALDRHVAAVSGWAAALLASIAPLGSPVEVETAVLLGAALGPWVGAAIHLVLVARAHEHADGPVRAPFP